jgi:DNA-binding XRE family transcriptional regulator
MEQGTPGARVQSARKRRGMTQRELAEASGLSLPAVKKIEQGAYGSMRLERARPATWARRISPVIPASRLPCGRSWPLMTCHPR